MKKLLILSKPRSKIDEYAFWYQHFYRQMYVDTGLWNENALIESYREQAEARKEEIYALLKNKLSPDSII